MSLESVLYSRLSGFAGLTALVGTRIYPSVLPQDVQYPAVSFHRIGGQPIPAAGSDPALKPLRVQVDCWAQDGASAPGTTDAYDSAASVAAQVLAALRRWRNAGSGVQAVYVENEGLDLFEAASLVHHRVLEFTVWFEG